MAVGSFKLPNTAATSTAVTDEWVRPSDWLAMPSIGTQEFIGLLAITDDEVNHIALTCQGAYTVDWGDGVTENVATNVKAQHTYTYSAISSGTLSTRGYKQVLVRVTPQAGQNLTTINLQQQNSVLAKIHVTGWLDIAIKGSNITTLSIGGGIVTQGMCENVDVYSMGSITSLTELFNSCYSLQKFTLPSTAAVTNFSYMFQNCYALKTIPLINTAAGTNFISMFLECKSLKTIPLLVTSSATSMSQMFGGCANLITIPLLDTANNLNFANMLDGCGRLQSMPLLNTIKGTNFGLMFRSCFSLQQLPNFNTALGTNFTSMLTSCTSLAKGAFQGTRYTISYSGFCLSQSAIVDIFNGLGTAVGTPTITVSSNPGRAALTAAEILIATSKGWTVV